MSKASNTHRGQRISSYYEVDGLSQRILDSFYGDDFVHGTLQFYYLIRARLRPHALVLDLGCGSGFAGVNSARDIRITDLTWIGLDIDMAIANNPQVDLKVLGKGEALPFRDNTFDLVFSDYVLEHVDDPIRVTMEVHRTLMPGGCFIFRTPNLYHYSMIASLLLPHKLKIRLAHLLRRKPNLVDPYPTRYQFNTRRTILKTLREVGFASIEVFSVEKEPSYLMFHWLPLLMGVCYERLVNRFEVLAGLRANIFAICQK